MPRQQSAGSILPSLPPGARILLIRLRSIGDIVLLTPALRLLKEWRPDLHVSVVVESRFRELLENNPDVNEILDPGAGSGWSRLASKARAIREIRRRKFALCVNLHGGPTSSLLTSWSGARWKAGFEHFRRRGVYQVLIPDARTILNKPTIHTAEHQASALFHLGLPRKEIPGARLFVGPNEESAWKERRVSIGLPTEGEYAVLHPTALYFTKQWAPENFARLGQYLEHDIGLPVIYSCGPGEAAALDAVEKASGGSVRRVEGASLNLFAAALAAARIFIGNDSGPAHMAAALGRPGVVIFGSSSSTIWGPWPLGGGWETVQNDYECNPCPGDRCYRFERPECILSVSYDQVRAAVDRVLARALPTPR
ncbi:MAG: glycosyltransferase family 9 protein [Terriglobia bacterium]